MKLHVAVQVPVSILAVQVLVVFPSMHSSDGFQLQGFRTSTALLTRGVHLSLDAKLSKDELNSLVASVGLHPANNTNHNHLKNKSKNKSTSSSSGKSSENNGTFNHRLPFKVLIRKIPIETQLEYSRNGSAALRSFLQPSVIRSIRSDLISYSDQKKLEAWRQKVEVGSNDPSRAQACRTISDCKRELARMDVNIQNIPFLQYFNTWRDVASVKDLCYALGQTASVLLDVPSVRLYQDALFEKRSGDGPTRWHTDARMAPFDTSNMLTFWIPLQDIPKHGTALLFVPKSHQDFALPFWNDFGGPEYDRLARRYQAADNTLVNHHHHHHYMPLKVGDVTVHSGWTLHCADGNDSEDDRLALAISYVDARAEIRETAMDFSPSNNNNKNAGGGGGGYGDNEDQWSYREWVAQVPPRTPFGTHPLVPIVWPSVKSVNE